MPKQCPDCRSIAQDDIGYCGACGSRVMEYRTPSFWPRLAVLAAAMGGIIASVLAFWKDGGPR